MDRILTAISSAIDEVNELRDDDQKIHSSFAGSLIGPEGILDSLGTATFLLSLESEISQSLGAEIDLITLLIDNDGLSENYDIHKLAQLINESI